MIHVPIEQLFNAMMNGTSDKLPASLNKDNASSSTSVPSRIRRLLEPLIMSIITTLVIFHLMFGSVSTSNTANQNVLDSPSSSSSGTQTTRQLPLVKRRFPDPPEYDFYAKLPADSPMPPIFYHIYIPDNPKAQTNALRIIKEQLEAFNPNHKKAGPQQKGQNVTVFYQTIGVPDSTIVTVDAIQGLCQERKMNCHHMGHDNDGREELTLQRTHEFCRHPSTNGHQRVVYMHNKGSHHKTPLNEKWRRKMMQAIQHEKCLNPPMETCTVCGLFTTAERGIFMAGNFWAAKCSYLKQLVPPLEFEGHMERVVKDALYLHLQGSLEMNLHRQWAPSFGIGRYAAELWAGSHPDVVPCDFSWSFQPSPKALDNTLDFLQWVNTTELQNKPLAKWTLAPKHPIKIAHKAVRTTEKLRLPEYHLLAGNVLRWYSLYGKVPGEFSWVWAWFPDGRKWRNAVRQHGRNALEELTKEFRTTDHD